MRIGDLPEDMQDLILQIAMDSGSIKILDEEDVKKALKINLPLYEIPVEAFPEVDVEHPDDDRDFESYVDTPINEFPPLVVAHGYFIDGNHRLYAARAQGVETVRTLDASKIFAKRHIIRQRFLGRMKVPR